MRINQRLIETTLKKTSAKSKVENVFAKTHRQVQICPFTIILGITNATEAGYEVPWNVKPSDFSTFSRIFNGKETIIAIWDNSTSYYKTKKIESTGTITLPQTTKINGTDYTIDKIGSWHDQNGLFLFMRDLVYLGGINNTGIKYIDNDGNEKELIAYDTTKSKSNYFKLVGSIDASEQWLGFSYQQVDDYSFFDMPYGSNTEPKLTIGSDKYFTKNFKIGDTIDCFTEQETLSGQFMSVSMEGSEYAKQSIAKTYTLMSKNRWVDTDMYKLYTIPELKSNQWLFIKEAKLYYDSEKKFRYSEIQLASLNDLIEKSGQAIQHYIHNGSAGEGFAFPLWNELDKKIELDGNKLKNYPITSIQIETNAPVFISTAYAMGRPLFYEPKDMELHPSRHLLPNAIKTPRINPLSKQQSPEQNYYACFGVKPTIDTFYKEWKEKVEAGYDQLVKKEYEGNLLFNDSAVVASNPINANGEYKYKIWDSAQKFTSDGQKYTTQASPYAESSITYTSDNDLGQFLSHNIFTMAYINSLPFNLKQSVKWTLKSLPLIGNIANGLTLGIPLGWIDTTNWIINSGINGIIGAPLYDFTTKSVYALDNSKGVIPLDIFREFDDNSNNTLSSTRSNSYILNFELTDQYQKGTETSYKNTVNLGQKINGTVQLWNQDCKPTGRDIFTRGYAIDAVVFQAIGKCDIRITYYNENQPIATGMYQSLSKFTGNLRDWTNAWKTSAWEREANNEYIDYPAKVNDKAPPTAPSDLVVKEYNVADSDYTYSSGLPWGNSPLSAFNFWASNVINNKTLSPNMNGTEQYIEAIINLDKIDTNISLFYQILKIELKTFRDKVRRENNLALFPDFKAWYNDDPKDYSFTVNLQELLDPSKTNIFNYIFDEYTKWKADAAYEYWNISRNRMEVIRENYSTIRIRLWLRYPKGQIDRIDNYTDNWYVAGDNTEGALIRKPKLTKLTFYPPSPLK